jgi:DNA polymerase-3 subunit delta'
VPFRDIAGHRRVIDLLARAIARGTMPPSLLMAGPDGVGKKRVALAMAQALNCPTPVSSPGIELDACGECATCRRIARLVHPAVVVIEPGDSGSIKIEPVRDAISQAQYRPFEGRRRVVIIDDADALVPAAQNALLKTLEEPPSASVFVLVTAIPDMLLPTVRSRCPMLRFGPLSAGEVATILQRDHDYSETDARAVAADAGGSVKRALQSATSDLADARADAQRLLEQTARLTDPVKRIDSVRGLVGKKGSPAGERDHLAVCLRALSSLLRDLGILATRADARMLANADLQGELQRLAPAWDSARSMRAFTAVDRALAALDRNASPKVVADWLVLQL